MHDDITPAPATAAPADPNPAANPASASAATSAPGAPAASALAAASAADDARSPEFRSEQDHLTETYDTLVSMARGLAAKLERTERDAAADKQAMSEELSVNLSSYADAMETYADFATLNRVIDAYNASQQIDAEKLASIGLLLRQPYFAKVVLRFKPGTPAKELYLGTAGVSDDNCRRLVVDWRSPVAEVYYNQENGRTSYEANGRTIEVDLELRRQFDIERNVLHSFFDTAVAIQDPLLLASLNARRTDRMQAITATIQKEQNRVVRHADVPALLVAGVAGSGKTSVLLQRIAYLFYRQRGTLDPSEVFLISPNPVFRRYIENVLPDLGESNPETVTWSELAASLLPAGAGDGKGAVPLREFARVDAALSRFEFDEADFREVRDNGVRFFTPGQIRQAMDKFRNAPAGPHRVTLVREELVRRAESRLAQMAASDEVHDEVSALPIAEQLRLFGETVDPADEREAAKLALTYLREKHAGAFAALEDDAWLRIDRIGMRLLDCESIHPLTWLYLKMGLTGLGNPDAKYVMVDEVQDYSAAQLAVLARYFRRANFLLLGDEHQAISENTASFDEVREVFRAARGQVEECRLLTSYRSTPEITSLFASLLDADERGRVSSVQREERAPLIAECPDEDSWERALREAVASALADAAGSGADAGNDEGAGATGGRGSTGGAGGLTAVVAPWRSEAKRLARLLAAESGEGGPATDAVRAAAAGAADETGSAPATAMDGAQVVLVGRGDALPERGVVVIALELAKGLEFDHVIVPDASGRVFPDNGDRIVRNRLYTTLSRATKHITLLSNGPMTTLLNR